MGKSDDVSYELPVLDDESGWGDKAVRCPMEFKTCVASGKAKKECVGAFLNCLMAKKSDDVTYELPVLDDESGWGDKAVRCPKEFKTCVASGKAKKECVGAFLNCLMAKKSDDLPVLDDAKPSRNCGYLHFKWRACLTRNSKEECQSKRQTFLDCLKDKKSDDVAIEPNMQQDGIISRTTYCTKRLAKCIASGAVKKRACMAYYAMCMAGSEEE